MWCASSVQYFQLCRVPLVLCMNISPLKWLGPRQNGVGLSGSRQNGVGLSGSNGLPGFSNNIHSCVQLIIFISPLSVEWMPLNCWWMSPVSAANQEAIHLPMHPLCVWVAISGLVVVMECEACWNGGKHDHLVVVVVVPL